MAKSRAASFRFRLSHKHILCAAKITLTCWRALRPVSISWSLARRPYQVLGTRSRSTPTDGLSMSTAITCRTSSQTTAYRSINPLMHKVAKMVTYNNGVQKTATKLIHGLNRLNYVECLKLWRQKLTRIALQMQRDSATHFVTCKNKSDFQAHSRSLVFMPFDRPCMISC